MSRGVPRSSGDTYNRAYQGLMLPEGHDRSHDTGFDIIRR